MRARARFSVPGAGGAGLDLVLEGVELIDADRYVTREVVAAPDDDATGSPDPSRRCSPRSRGP